MLRCVVESYESKCFMRIAHDTSCRYTLVKLLFISIRATVNEEKMNIESAMLKCFVT